MMGPRRDTKPLRSHLSARLLVVGLFAVHPGVVIAQSADETYQREYEKCMAKMDVLEPVLSAAGMTKQSYCEGSSESERAWVIDGRITVKVDREGCDALGHRGETAIECLPQSFEGVKTVKVESTIDAKTALVLAVMDRLRALGAEEIIMAVSE